MANDLTPTAPVARHITKLINSGMAATTIAAHTGLSVSTIYDTHHQRRTHMKTATAKRITVVKPDPESGRTVDATGAVRRMRSLIAEGRTQTWIAAQLCWPEAAVCRLLAGRRTRITHDSRQLIDDLYRAAEQMPPVRACYAARSKRRAAAAGWHGRDAWWDDTIDDPTIGPYFAGRAVDDGVDDVLVQRAIDGDDDAVRALNRAERLEATRRLLARGVRAGAVSGRLNVGGQAAAKLVAAVAA